MKSTPTSNATRAQSTRRFIEFSCLSDTRMDQKGAYFNGDPLNPLPVRCPVCRFPNLDFVHQPYFILRAPSMTPTEIGGSNYGYLLVKNRFKEIVELLFPKQCLFLPTTYLKTVEVTPWWLMMPVNFCRTGVVKSSIARCSSCGEPFSSHGTEYEGRTYGSVESPEKLSGEIYKTENWLSAEKASGGPKSWVHRSTVISLRFFHLLRELKIAGLYGLGPAMNAEQDETTWVREQLQCAKDAGIRATPVGVVNSDSQKWFKAFLKANGGAGAAVDAVSAIENAHKIRFSKSYLEFVKKVGGRRFFNIDSEEGLNADLLLPEECDLAHFRQGKLVFEDEESRQVDGIVFASTEFGDCFCFDLKKDKKESEVFVYRHEYNCFEPYAENFIECLKRFTAGDQDEETE